MQKSNRRFYLIWISASGKAIWLEQSNDAGCCKRTKEGSKPAGIYWNRIINAVKGTAVHSAQVLRRVHRRAGECVASLLDWQDPYPKCFLERREDKRAAQNKKHSFFSKIFIPGFALAWHSLEQAQLGTGGDQAEQRLYCAFAGEDERGHAGVIKTLAKCQIAAHQKLCLLYSEEVRGAEKWRSERLGLPQKTYDQNTT